MNIKDNHWVKKGNASILTFDVKVSCYFPEQLENAVKWLVEQRYSYSWEVERGDSFIADVYSLVIEEMSWAANLKEFAEILEKTDYLYEETVDNEEELVDNS